MKRNIFNLLLLISLCFLAFPILGNPSSTNDNQEFEVNPFLDVNPLSIVSRLTQLDNDTEEFNTTLFELLLDAAIPFQLADSSVPGMVISAANSDGVFLTKGYGYTDNNSTDILDVNSTTFRLGSLSIPVLSTAIMKLVEDGQLDLNTDINTYLSLKHTKSEFFIPNTFQKPITLTHLLTHTAGFEAINDNGLYIPENESIDLFECLKEKLPRRVRPVGDCASYSDYGIALAGYIIECVRNMDFADYIKDTVFTALEMGNSSFDQPASDVIANLSQSFDNQLNSVDYLKYRLSPTRALSSTANDMGKFMSFLLGFGKNSDLLNHDSVKSMLSTKFSWHDKIANFSGITLGMTHMDSYNQSILGVQNGFQSYHSFMFFLPEKDLGIFFSYNSDNVIRQDSYLPNDIFNAFFLNFYPFDYSNSSRVNSISNFRSRSSRFVGEYLTNTRQFNNSNIFRIDVRRDENGYLVLQNIWGPFFRFVEIEKNLFLEASGNYQVYLAFKTNEKGLVTSMYSNAFGNTVGFDKLHTYYTISEMDQLIIALSNIVFFAAMIIWLYRDYQYLKIKKFKQDLIYRSPRWLFYIAFIISEYLQLTLKSQVTMKDYILIETKTQFAVLDSLASLITILIFIQVILAALMWFKWYNTIEEKRLPITEPAFYTVVVVFSLAYIPIFSTWMLGFL